MIQTTLSGDWSKIQSVINNLNTNLKVGAITKLKEDSQSVADKLQENILNNDNKPDEIGKYNHTGIWWVDREILFNSITPMAYTSSGGYGVFVGFKGDHPDSDGWSNADLAEHLEKTNIPVVAPTWAEMEGKILESWNDYMNSLIHGGVSI